MHSFAYKNKSTLFDINQVSLWRRVAKIAIPRVWKQFFTSYSGSENGRYVPMAGARTEAVRVTEVGNIRR